MLSGNDRLRRRETLPLLLPFERASYCLIAALAAVVALLSWSNGIAIDLASFRPMAAVVGLLFALAAAYRLSGRSANIPLALMAVAIYIAYSNVAAVLNYLLVPVGEPTLDALLIELDRMIGFDWATSVRLVEAYPSLSLVLNIVYRSSLAQLAAIILLLGLTSREETLHRFLACGIIASMICVLFWSVFPSIGPAAWIEVPLAPDAIPRVVDTAYIAGMHDLLTNGVQTIDGRGMLGVVAFPSLHTVMMCMSVWYVRNTKALPLFVALNVPMAPAIVVHGGHHLIDVFAGLALFPIAAWLAHELVGLFDQVHTASGGRLIRIASILPPVLRPKSVPRS